MNDTAPDIPGYTFHRIIGRGGMSTVWHAWDEAHNRPVAIKVLNLEFAASGEDVRAFRVEEQVMEEINHPGIVKAYDFDCHKDQWFLVMEYIDGYNFGELLGRKGKIAERDCLLICESVAAALGIAWRDHRIVHCDLKPENIMINSDGIVKLTDLGIAHRCRKLNSAQAVPDQVIGTPAYISPEQVYGDVELDCRSDIYSLGATLYHLATGQMLFAGLSNEESLRAHCDETKQALSPDNFEPELSIGFIRLLEAMLVKDRDNRIQGWSEVYDICAAIEEGAEIGSRETEGASSIAIK